MIPPALVPVLLFFGFIGGWLFVIGGLAYGVIHDSDEQP